MTKQEQIEEMAKDLENTILGLGIHLCRKSAEKLYDLGYRKGETISYKAMIDHSYLDRINELLIDFDEMGFAPTTLCENPDEYAQDWKKQLLLEIKRLKAENEQLKAKLEKNPLAIKQKIMEEDDYELTEREQATLFLDRMGSDVEILHDIVENLDELLGKGIDEYIKGIDGVEGLKDMWERSAVREFADKLKARINADYVNGCLNNYKGYLTEYDINEELKEYE